MVLLRSDRSTKRYRLHPDEHAKILHFERLAEKLVELNIFDQNSDVMRETEARSLWLKPFRFESTRCTQVAVTVVRNPVLAGTPHSVFLQQGRHCPLAAKVR